MEFKTWLLSEEIAFQTAKGSSYVFSNGRTFRTKAAHVGHYPDDVGKKQQSEKTVFISPDLAREIGMWQTSSSTKKRVVLFGDRLFLLSISKEKHGLDKIYADNRLSLQPEIGLSPLELWQRDEYPWTWLKQGMEVFAGTHPGNAITQISNQTQLS